MTLLCLSYFLTKMLTNHTNMHTVLAPLLSTAAIQKLYYGGPDYRIKPPQQLTFSLNSFGGGHE